jgi:hypothetical protein
LEASSGQPHQRRQPPLLQAARQRRRPPLHRRLASDGSHLCTGGLPATAATSARAKRSSPPSSYGGVDKTIQECGHHLHGVRRLVRPLERHQSSVAGGAGDATDAADLRTARPSSVRWTDSRWEAALEAAPKPSKPKRWSHSMACFPPQRVGARGMVPWLSPLPTFMRLVIILPPECWRKKREGALPPRTSRGGRR